MNFEKFENLFEDFPKKYSKIQKKSFGKMFFQNFGKTFFQKTFFGFSNIFLENLQINFQIFQNSLFSIFFWNFQYFQKKHDLQKSHLDDEEIFEKKVKDFFLESIYLLYKRL